MFFSDNLGNIDHCFFSRLGGVSLNNYKSLNCGPGSNDYKPYIQKNRLAVSKYFNLNEDLCETLSLAHDLGHTPFGHAGEDVLNNCIKNFGGFDHNIQTLRIITFLESLNVSIFSKTCFSRGLSFIRRI